MTGWPCSNDISHTSSNGETAFVEKTGTNESGGGARGWRPVPRTAPGNGASQHGAPGSVAGMPVSMLCWVAVLGNASVLTVGAELAPGRESKRTRDAVKGVRLRRALQKRIFYYSLFWLRRGLCCIIDIDGPVRNAARPPTPLCSHRPRTSSIPVMFPAVSPTGIPADYPRWVTLRNTDAVTKHFGCVGPQESQKKTGKRDAKRRRARGADLN